VTGAEPPGVPRILVQIPEPSKHLIHSYGRYANTARAKRKRDAAAEGQSMTATAAATGPAASEPDSAERKAARKRWANLIRHIYEVDPLVCPRCGGMMKIISFITQQGVIRAILDRAANTHPIHGRLAPPPTRRSPGHGWRALKAEQAKERATRANIDRGPRSACAPRSGGL
jgi:hypothetical protein